MSDTPPANPPADDPADLRKKLDRALTENRQLKVSNALHQGGLGHLTEVQRQAMLLTIPKDTELTADNLKAQATALGFPLEVAPPAPPPGDPGTPPATGEQGDPSTIPPTMEPSGFLTPFPGSPHPDPRVAASISGLTEQEYAHIQGLRAQAGHHVGAGLDEAMSKATSKEEAVAALRQHGSSAGLLLDSDLE